LDADPSSHLQELQSIERLGQNIGKMIIAATIVDSNLALLYTLPYVVILRISVLTPVMMHWILAQCDCRLVVNIEHHSFLFLVHEVTK
jgi:hypothetical protein